RSKSLVCASNRCPKRAGWSFPPLTEGGVSMDIVPKKSAGKGASRQAKPALPTFLELLTLQCVRRCHDRTTVKLRIVNCGSLVGCTGNWARRPHARPPWPDAVARAIRSLGSESRACLRTHL